MFWTVLRFELAYHWRRASTYLFFATLFLLAFFAMASDAVQLFDSQGQVKKNAPIILAQSMSVLCAFGQVITTALMGTAILRDVQLKSHELLFTTRVTRAGYLGGRFVGAFLVMLFVYLAIPLGSWVGTLMPWVDHDQLQAFRFLAYAQPFLVIVVPNILFVSALFFAVGAITRNLLAIYVQGVALFTVWAISQNILTDLDKLSLASLVDPFALTTIGISRPVLDDGGEERTPAHGGRSDPVESGAVAGHRGRDPGVRVLVRPARGRGAGADATVVAPPSSAGASRGREGRRGARRPPGRWALVFRWRPCASTAARV